MSDTTQSSHRSGNPPCQSPSPSAKKHRWAQIFGTASQLTPVFGNLSQILSALFSMATCGVAVYGVWTTAPFFKNKLLTEQNAQLEINIKEIRKVVWSSVCDLTASRIPFDIDLMAQDEHFTFSADKFRALEGSTYRAALHYALGRTDSTGLTEEDRAKFKSFASTFDRTLPIEFDQLVEKQLVGISSEFIPLGIEKQLVDTFAKACRNASPG